MHKTSVTTPSLRGCWRRAVQIVSLVYISKSDHLTIVLAFWLSVQNVTLRASIVLACCNLNIVSSCDFRDGHGRREIPNTMRKVDRCQ